MSGNEGNETAVVKCSTSKGDIKLQMYRHWSPHGYDRAVELFEKGWYDDSHFYRVVPNFLVQFGISYTTDEELKQFARQTIEDDRQLEPRIRFEPGIIAFAGSGNNSRTSQMFISLGSASSLGTQPWETPVGKVLDGLDNVKQFYSYGDMPPWGSGPVQGKIHAEGAAYIENEFPFTDKFIKCDVQRSGGEVKADATRLDFITDDAPTSQTSVLLAGAIVVFGLVVVFWIKMINRGKKDNKMT